MWGAAVQLSPVPPLRSVLEFHVNALTGVWPSASIAHPSIKSSIIGISRFLPVLFIFHSLFPHYSSSVIHLEDSFSDFTTHLRRNTNSYAVGLSHAGQSTLLRTLLQFYNSLFLCMAFCSHHCLRSNRYAVISSHATAAQLLHGHL